MDLQLIVSRMLKRLQKMLGRYPPVVEDIVFVFIGMVLAIVFYHVLGFGLKTSEPIVTVVSLSMYPTLDRGDLLVLKGVEPDEIQVGNEKGQGDIIVYICPSTAACPGIPSAPRLIVHRAYERNEDGTFKTWGDHNVQPDRWNVEPTWIRGKVVLRVPYLGYPRLLLGDLISALRNG